MKKFQPIFVAVGLMCLTAPVFAHWEIGYKKEGVVKSSIYPNGIAWNEIGGGFDADECGQAIVFAEPHKTGFVGVEGWVTAVIKWVPDGGDNNPPPRYASFLASPYIHLEWDKSLVPEEKVAFTLADSSGKQDGYQVAVNGHIFQKYAKRWSYLIRIDTADMKRGDDGLLTKELPHCDLKPSISLDNPSGEDAEAQVIFNYSAQEDTRVVKLSRGVNDAEHPDREKFKLEKGEWHTYGDSIYSAKPKDPTINNESLFVPLDIAVAYSGGWKTTAGNIYYDVTPTWDKSGFLPDSGFGFVGENESHCYGYTEYGSATVYRSPLSISPRQYAGSPTEAKTFDTSYTAKDNGDQATATAHYHLTLHDPVEMLDEGEETTDYQVTKPYTHGGVVLSWPGVRDASSVTIEINDETSTEVGLGLKATADLSAFKDLLGLSAEANYTSTHKFTKSIKTEVPKDIAAGQFKYLIAIHNFTRRHKRFYMFDASGKIPRMVNVDSIGRPISPSVDMYHELIEDTAGQADARWSVSLPGPMDETSLPREPPPPAKYDYPSGGSS